MLAATKKAEKKLQALKIDLVYQGRYNIMRKSVHKLGSFATVLAATKKAEKKPQVLKIDLVDKRKVQHIKSICPQTGKFHHSASS